MHYDLIVIGSGPAGEKGAAAAAYFGKKVALVEKEPALGGAAANTGTLPSKTLRETALFLSGFQQRKLKGLHVAFHEKVTVRDFMSRERLIVHAERDRIRANLDRHHVDLYRGAASFIDPNTVSVDSPDGHKKLRSDFLLITTGSYPYRPPQFDFDDPRVYDSDTILHLHEIPESMLVVGGGVIGCEYACMFAALGIKITVVERRDRVVGFLDEEVFRSLENQMKLMGIRFQFGDTIDSVDQSKDPMVATLNSGANLETHTILVSSGRSGNTASLCLDKIGLEVDNRGRIPVINEHYQTSVPNVYAAGDVIGFPALASTSMEQARVAVAHAFNFHYRRGKVKERIATILPYGIYTIPECSMAGETEHSLQEKQIPYVTGKAPYRQNARGQIVGDDEGFLKLIFKMPDLELLGVHVIGEQATEIVHVGLTALLAKADVDLFINTCFNYPTFTELYKYAAYDALGKVDHAQEKS